MPVVKYTTAPKLVEIENFGSNPGSLRCHLFLPTILPPKAPLIVVLHGCTQTAAGFDNGSGWSQLAEEKGIAVLFPEQRRENNANLCFNWFEPADTRRDCGEALSIREMISHIVLSHGLDGQRVFICGLSAGGAMANVMLATYPEVFAAGAIIGGLAYGVASSVGQAFERMKGRNPPSPAFLKSVMEKASPKPARRPRISIWHGTHDQVVRPINAEQIASQWVGDISNAASPDVETMSGYLRKSWHTSYGTPAVELNLVSGMGHGVPLSSKAVASLGSPGPFMLETGISSTARIARTWGLVDDAYVSAAESQSGAEARSSTNEGIEDVVAKAMELAKAGLAPKRSTAGKAKAVGDVINDALRSAGLLR
ncbi:PHB depolymerase family esterase [bacterium]|nr:MAG: PHB depolymerase family esterase [bacterium]